jgi:hypothetical protein
LEELGTGSGQGRGELFWGERKEAIIQNAVDMLDLDNIGVS